MKEGKNAIPENEIPENEEPENKKKSIKGFVKKMGKFTLKGLGKGIELTSRGAVKTINSLVKNEKVQKIATGAGILAAGVMVPPVGVGLMATLGLKYIIDKSIRKNDKGILDEVKDILRAGTAITRSTSKLILSPTLTAMDRGMGEFGKNYQDEIDSMFT